jgi:transcriptional regulator with XRE-family HTH domain
MGLTQAELAARLRVWRNTVARMESGIQAITPSMELLISFVAREAGVEAAALTGKGRRASRGKGKHGGDPRPAKRQGRPRQGSDQVS